MINIPPLSLAGLLIASCCFTLTAILLKYGTSWLHRLWAIFNTAVGAWGIGCILIGLSQTVEVALVSWKIALTGGYTVAFIFFHTVTVFTGQKLKKLVYFGYLLSVILLVSNLLFLGNPSFGIVKPLFNSLYFIRSTSLFHHTLLFGWILYAIMGNVLLYKFFAQSRGQTRNRAGYFFLSMFVGFLGGSMNVLIFLGLDISPNFNFTIPIYCIIATYALLRHKLMDIEIVIKKGLLYSILTIIITLAYFLLILISEKALQGAIGYRSIFASLAIAMLIAIFFIPVRNWVQNLIDNHFFTGTREQIAEENRLLKEEVSQTERFKCVATLASGIAHEIKNPITTIKTFFDHIPDKKDDPEFLEKLTRIAGHEIDRVSDLVQQLLEFAKPSPTVFKEVRVQGLIDETLTFIAPQIRKNNIQLTKEFNQDSDITLQLDPNKIKQALLNILLNAIDAMPQGGTLTISTQLEASSNSLAICIQDTGCGIDKKDLPHIFDPFFSKKDGGTGLGLAISRGIIEEHRGEIKAESKLGEGSNLRIKIPFK